MHMMNCVNKSLDKFLEDNSHKFSSNIALIDDDKMLSYKELFEDVEILKNKYLKNIISKGDRILIQLENSISYVTYFFAILQLEAIPILMHEKYSFVDVKKIIEKVQASYWITDESISEEMCYKIKNQFDIKSKSTKIGKQVITSFCWDNKLKTDVNLAGFMILSSGSTGVPKLIERKSNEFLYLVECLQKKAKFTPEVNCLITGPLSHIFPLLLLFAVLESGGTVNLTKYVTPIDILDTISEKKITVLASVPSLLRMILLSVDSSIDNHLKKIICGGEPLHQKDKQLAMESFKCSIANLYGSGEGVFTYLEHTLKDIDKDITRLGKPVSELDQIKIINCTNSIGEMIVKGPYSIKNYFQIKNDMNSFTKDGFYKTGDLVRIDDEGNMYFVGRSKEIINRCGEKIVPSEVEEFIRCIPNVIECAVCGVEDELLGQKIVAFIVFLDNKSKLDKRHIQKQLINLGLSYFKIPDEVIEVISIPKTVSGKLLRRQLLDEYIRRKNK